ncbi:MAG: neutral zinc metallopeptidase [Gemmataceae bacterium]|nr:neutral zinc metallopeptidase [Gemmataceae bacterium]
MEWEGREESSNVEDRRAFGTKAAVIGGGSIIVVVIALLLGVNPQKLADMFGGAGGAPDPNQPQVQRKASPEEERQAKFTRVILHDTEVVWDDLFRRMGKTYQKPVLVLFSGSVSSACGMADSAVGPFYCPGDSKIYIDLSFYQDMERKLNAPGEFARAYVIAHEVGHHVQRLLGYSARVDEVRRRGDKIQANQASVRLELQADFLAGVWAHHGQKRFNFLEKGDIDSALNAAFEIGDDRLQKKGRGRVVPDSFTHGTSQQRMRWFREGFDTGNVNRASLLFELPYDEL